MQQNKVWISDGQTDMMGIASGVYVTYEHTKIEIMPRIINYIRVKLILTNNALLGDVTSMPV